MLLQAEGIHCPLCHGGLMCSLSWLLLLFMASHGLHRGKFPPGLLFISCCANACGKISSPCTLALSPYCTITSAHPIPPFPYLHPFLNVHPPLLSSQPQAPASHPESTPRGPRLGTAFQGILTSLPSATWELRPAGRPALALGREGQWLPERCSNKSSLIKKGSGAGWRARAPAHASSRALPGTQLRLPAHPPPGRPPAPRLPAPPTQPQLQGSALPLASLQACCPRRAAWPFSPCGLQSRL